MHEDDAQLRETIRQRLAGGLHTRTEPVPRDHREFDGILRELHGLADHQLDEKLTISGFMDKPYGKDRQRCHDCMYYLAHRKWCALPQLAVPVEPDWWCRLWRI